MHKKLLKIKAMVITALFINYKLNEDPMLRSTLDILLEPLVAKELESFMLLLTNTPRKFRSVLELVADVVKEIIQNRVSNEAINKVVQNFQIKFRSLMDFALLQIHNSSFDNEKDFLNSLKVEKLKEKNAPLFDKKELFIIKHITFSTMLMLFNSDPFLFEKRIKDAIEIYENKIFEQKHLLSASKKTKNINEPTIIKKLAHDKRI